MAQSSSKSEKWDQGWGVVRQVQEKLELIAVFETQEEAAAAAKAHTDYETCWLSYKTTFWTGQIN